MYMTQMQDEPSGCSAYMKYYDGFQWKTSVDFGSISYEYMQHIFGSEEDGSAKHSECLAIW